MFAGCSKGGTVHDRSVTVHVPAACPAGSAAYATYEGLGDFEPSTPQEGHYLYDVGTDLPEIDPRARVVVVQATEAAEAGGSEGVWQGLAALPPSGDVDVLVLPELASCALSGAVGPQGDAVPPRTGSTLGPIGSGGVMLAGGVGTGAQTFVADLDTGEVTTVNPDLLHPRSHATVTAFGSGALVAGGIDPGGAVLQTAEVYEPTMGGFDQQNALVMSAARSEHGAVVLATGETLLVGGVGADGKTVLGTMEILDPATRVVRAEGVAQLTTPRKDPAVLLLASGEVLVAGGYDASGAPVTMLEWFTADVSLQERTQLVGTAGTAQAFAALEAGGALVVQGSGTGSSCSLAVWQVSAERASQQAPSVPCNEAPSPVFFGGAGGAPVLWTGEVWLRWQPWSGTFASLDVLDHQAATIGDAWCSPDPGMALWLDPSTSQLTALRFDTTNAYSPLPTTLVTGASSLAPDLLPLPGVASFDTQSPEGQLDLGLNAGAFVTDRTYGDLALDVDMPMSQAAVVVVRDAAGNEVDVGGVDCPASLSPPSPLHVERHGATVTWSTTPGGASGTCQAPFDANARVSVGLRGPGGARALSVTRLSP